MSKDQKKIKNTFNKYDFKMRIFDSSAIQKIDN